MASSGSSDQTPTDDPNSYRDLSRRPLQSLFFLLPLVLVYEAALPIFGTDQLQHVEHDIYARRILDKLFEYFGVTGVYLPGVIVLVVLLSWHVVSRDRWRFEPCIYGWMWVESLGLALPLFVLMLVLFGQPTSQWALMQATDYVAVTWQAQLVFSIGAGIYEELLFRLFAIALIHLVLVDMLAMSQWIGAIGAVTVSALAFALYHFGVGNPFDWIKCLFFTVAGVYFAAVYLLRGFGIAAGCHALYDVMVVAMSMTQGISH